MQALRVASVAEIVSVAGQPAFLVALSTTLCMVNMALNAYNIDVRFGSQPHTIREASTLVEATVRHPASRFEVIDTSQVLLNTVPIGLTRLWAPPNVSNGTHAVHMCAHPTNVSTLCSGFKAPTALDASATYVLPVALPGSPGELLSCTVGDANASGQLQWYDGVDSALVQVGTSNSTVYLNSSPGALHLQGTAWPAASPTGADELLESTGPGTTAWVVQPVYLRGAAVAVGDASTTSAIEVETTLGGLTIDGTLWADTAPAGTGQLLQGTGLGGTEWVAVPAYLTGPEVVLGGPSSVLNLLSDTDTAEELHLGDVAWPRALPTASGELLETTAGAVATQWATAQPTFLRTDVVQVGEPAGSVTIDSSAGSLRCDGTGWPATSPLGGGDLLESTSASGTQWATQPAYLSSSTVGIGTAGSAVTLSTSAGGLSLGGVAWPAAAATGTGELLEASDSSTAVWVGTPSYLSGATVEVGSGAASTVIFNTTSTDALYLNDAQWPTALPAADQNIIGTATNSLGWQNEDTGMAAFATTTFDMGGGSSWFQTMTCRVSRDGYVVILQCPGTAVLASGQDGWVAFLPVGYRPRDVTSNAVFTPVVIGSPGTSTNYMGRINVNEQDGSTYIWIQGPPEPVGGEQLMPFQMAWLLPE